MINKRLVFRLLSFALTAALLIVPAAASDEREDAPIVEQRMDYFDFTLNTTGGKRFNLKDYLAGKQVVIVSYVAAWCPNSVRNGHILKRLYDSYRDKGLGVVAVAEYSNAEEMRVFVNRIGIDYPVVVETSKRGARKKSLHYKLRQRVGDKRKWGTPFYVIIDGRDIEAGADAGVLARRVYTVSGEIIESEAEQFLKEHLRDDPQ
jgi:peroxiredoxin